MLEEVGEAEDRLRKLNVSFFLVTHLQLTEKQTADISVFY